MLQPAPLHDAQAPGVVPGQLANHWLHCGGGQLAPGLAVQRVALEVHQALALPGDAVYVARAIEQVAHFAQAMQVARFTVAQHVEPVADAVLELQLGFCGAALCLGFVQALDFANDSACGIALNECLALQDSFLIRFLALSLAFC